MLERRIQIADGARLTLVEMARDVSIDVWDEGDVLVRLRDGEDRDLVVEATEEGPAISAQRACELLVPPTVAVTIRQARGNLAVKGLQAGLDAEQVRANLKLSDVGSVVVAEVYGNLEAKVVVSLRVVGTVYGNAGLKEISAVDLQNVRGNVRAKAVGSLRASRIGGNLQAKGVEATVDADQVGGNTLLADVGGLVSVDQVAGNLAAQNLRGGARVPQIGGNLALNGELGTGRSYHFVAKGNAALRLSEEASAHLSLKAGGKILSSAPLTDETREGSTLTGALGEGGAEMVVEARGNILLGSGRAALAGLGEEVSRQVEESLRAVDWEAIKLQAIQGMEEGLRSVDVEAISQQVKAELRGVEESLRAADFEALALQVKQETEQALSRLQVKLDSVDWDRIGHRTQRAVEQAMERLERDVDRLAEKAARRQERLLRGAEREARREEEKAQRLAGREVRRRDDLNHAAATAGVEAVERQPEVQVEPGPDLDEERLSILRMVEQGQISPEEAEMLLDALE